MPRRLPPTQADDDADPSGFRRICQQLLDEYLFENHT
jgi:hypothetical protein